MNKIITIMGQPIYDDWFPIEIGSLYLGSLSTISAEGAMPSAPGL